MYVYLSLCNFLCMRTGHVYFINADVCIYEWSMLMHACNDMCMCVHIYACVSVCVCVLSFFKVLCITNMSGSTTSIQNVVILLLVLFL